MNYVTQIYFQKENEPGKLIKAKDGTSYTDDIALRTMELSTHGVPARSMGKVQQACAKTFTGEPLEAAPAPRTVTRMIQRGGIMSDLDVSFIL